MFGLSEPANVGSSCLWTRWLFQLIQPLNQWPQYHQIIKSIKSCWVCEMAMLFVSLWRVSVCGSLSASVSESVLYLPTFSSCLNTPFTLISPFAFRHQSLRQKHCVCLSKWWMGLFACRAGSDIRSQAVTQTKVKVWITSFFPTKLNRSPFELWVLLCKTWLQVILSLISCILWV